MLCVLVAEVMVPLAMPQAYAVMPAGPEAVLPVEFAQATADVVMVASGVGFTVSVAVCEVLLQLAITVATT